MKLRAIITVTGLAVLLSATSLAQQETLSNKEILEMTRAGLSPALIIRMIDTARSDFDISSARLIELKKAGVTDEVIGAMLDAFQKPELSPPGDQTGNRLNNNANPSPTTEISRVVLDKSEALRNAKTIAITKSSLHPSRQALEKELFKRKDWQALNLNVVRLKEDADLYVEIGYVSMSWLSHRYVYRVYHRKSGTVIVAGETTSWGSLSKNLARGISKRLSNTCQP